MRWVVAAALAAAGCSFTIDGFDPGSGGAPDLRGDLAGRDAATGPDLAAGGGDAGLGDSAAGDFASADLGGVYPLSHLPEHYLSDGTCAVKAAMSINADNGDIDGAASGCAFAVETEADGTKVGVLAVKMFTIDGGKTVKVTGGQGLAIVASDRMMINGTLDASGVLDAQGPGGAGPASGSGAGGNGTGAGDFTKSGGSGAGYGLAGASGGSATSGPNTATPNGPGGAWGDAMLKMGVPGGSGGGKMVTETGDCGFPGGGGGGGGGAVQLSALNAVSVGQTGVVNAGGGGGHGGCTDGMLYSSSGGGGGSGGAIFIEAKVVTIAGALAANGGGGGGGADFGQRKNGGPGGNGGPDTTQAAGGTAGGGGGTAGGAGGSLANGAMVGANETGFGNNAGGGGGGVGRILIRSRGPSTMTGIVTPAAVADPTL